MKTDHEDPEHNAGSAEQHAALPASGQQFEIVAGEQRATVVEVGGGLRSYTVGDTPVLDGYNEDEQCTGARGHPLIPWPNRIADGAYCFDGEEHQLALTEPDKHNAIHGLLRWRNWQCRHHDSDRVVMGCRLYPMQGYPFTLDVSIDYHLDTAGLSVRTRATNLGSTPCPYAAGQHPYLHAGGQLVDACTLQLDAEQWLPIDAQGIPTEERPVAGSTFDFRTGRGIGDQNIDNTFTGLRRDADGRAWVRLTRPNRWQVGVWVDQNYPFVEIYTAHTQPPPHHRTGLGVEPMTCAPNAYRSGDGLHRLEPGRSATAAWGLVVPTTSYGPASGDSATAGNRAR